MNILIAYGTTEGHTRKVVDAVRKSLQGLNHEVRVFDTSGLKGDLDPLSFDKIIVAGSVHDKQHQESVEIFIIANREKLKSKPTMFVSVSLAAAFDDGMSEAQSYVDGFYDRVDWRPTQSLLVAGALRHDQYGYYREQFVEHVVLKDRKLEHPEQDHEFTDWPFLEQAVDAFVGGKADN